MIKLLEGAIEALKQSPNTLKMTIWYNEYPGCGTCSCICGGMSLLRLSDTYSHDTLQRRAMAISSELDEASYNLFGTSSVATAIYAGTAVERYATATFCDVFAEDDLKHPPLTQDHSNKAIAIDFIQLVLKKVRAEAGGAKEMERKANEEE